MAFCGHVNAEGEIIHDEVYNGHTSFCRREVSEPVRRSWSPNSKADREDSSARTYIIYATKRGGVNTVRYQQSQQQDTPIPSDHSSPAELYSSEPSSSTSSDCRSPESLYSWTDMYEALKGTGKNERLVPSLDLSTGTIEPGDTKMHRAPEAAYENWYSAKQKKRMLKQMREKEKREHEEQMAMERRRSAEECYRIWCHKKDRLAAEQRMSQHIAAAAYNLSGNSVTFRPQSVKAVRNVAPERVKLEVNKWFEHKAQLMEQERQARRKAELLKRKEQERRKLLSEKAWEMWISKVNEKPKPVPLNQGMASLRGTISELYINPKSWQTPTPFDYKSE